MKKFVILCGLWQSVVTKNSSDLYGWVRSDWTNLLLIVSAKCVGTAGEMR